MNVPDADELEALLDRAGLPGASAIVAATDPGAGVAEVRPRAPISPASMIKVPIAFALDERLRAGDLRAHDRVLVEASNLTANDAPSPFEAGTSASLSDLARAMLSASDNTATNVLIDVLTRERIDASSAALGLRDTHVRRKLSGRLPLIDDPAATGRNAHPPDDAARLFVRLADPRRRPAWIFEALAAAVWNTKLSRGFAGDRFAHKTGDTDEVSHDGGVLVDARGRTYAIVVYASVGSSPDVDDRFAAFARLLRSRLASQD